MSKEHECKIYVASLSDYNSGISHGVWIDMQEMDTKQDIIERIINHGKYNYEES